jgi:hypothetical protein
MPKNNVPLAAVNAATTVNYIQMLTSACFMQLSIFCICFYSSLKNTEVFAHGTTSSRHWHYNEIPIAVRACVHK